MSKFSEFGFRHTEFLLGFALGLIVCNAIWSITLILVGGK